MAIAPILPGLGRLATTPAREKPPWPTLPRRRRARRISKEEEASVLDDVLSGLLSGVQYVGETLDKPGSAVRGVMSGATGGDWGGGLLNLIPFSDTLGISDPQERVYGQELLERWGVTPENKPGLNWDLADIAGDVGGFAFELATDPLIAVTGPLGSYARGSKLAAAARPAAKLAGQTEDLARLAKDLAKGAAGKTPTIASTPATIAQQIRAGERGIVGLHVPFTKPRVAYVPKSQKVRDITAKAVEKMFYGGGPISGLISAPIRGVRGLLSKSAGGTFAGQTQMVKDFAYTERQALRDLFTDAAPAIDTAWKGLEQEFRRTAEFFGKAGDQQAANDFFRRMVEIKGGVPQGQDLLGELQRSLTLDASSAPFGSLSHSSKINRLMERLGREALDIEADVANVYRKWGLKPGAVKIHVVGGRVKRKAIKAGTDIDLLVHTERPLPSLTDETLAAQKEALETIWDRFRDMEGGAHIHVVDQGRRPIPTTSMPLENARGLATPSMLAQLGDVDSLAGRWHETLDGIVRAEDSLYTRYLELGGKGQWLEDLYAAHGAGRYPSSYRVAKAAIEGKPVGGTGDVAFWLHRDPVWRNYPGATVGINQIVRNPLFTATAGKRTGKAGQELRGELFAELRRSYGVTPKATEKAVLERLQRSLDDLQQYGIKETLGKTPSVQTLQRATLWETLVRRHMDEAWPDPSAVRMLGEQEVTYASEIRRFWNPRPVTKTTELGRPITTVRDGALDQLLTKVSRLPAEAVDRGLFDRRVVDDFGDYTESILGQLATVQQAHSLLGRTGAVWREGTKEGGVALTDAWRDAGFQGRGLGTFLTEHPQLAGMPAGDPGIIARAMKADPKVAKAFMEQADEILPTLRVHEGTANALKALGEVAEPRNQGAFAKLASRITAMYKSWLFLPYVAPHTRNWASGFWNAKTDGTLSLKQLTVGHGLAVKHLTTGSGIKDMERLRRIGIFEGTQIADIAGEAAEAGLGLRQAAPVGFLGGILKPLHPKNLRTSYKQLLNPTAVRGGPGFFRTGVPALPIEEFRKLKAEATAAGTTLEARVMNPIMEAGEQAYQRIEFINRAGYGQALLDAGYSDSQVRYYVTRSQFKYSEMSRFEKETMRQLVPFYGWIRNNLPLQFQKLLERPGGQAAQTYRLFLQGQRPQEGKPHTPQFLREMMAAPVGEGAGGFQTFMRQSGLPIEDLNRFVFEGGIPSTKTIRKFASQLHPLLIGPWETWGGKQLWTGRPLKHMASQTEALTKAVGVEGGVRMPWLDRAIAMSFGSRAVGEAMQVAHPEKAWPLKALNAATGMRFSTYDVEKWRLLDMKNQLAEMVEASPYVYQGEYQYVPERYKPRAGKERKQLQVLRALEQASKKLSERRRREGRKGP